MSEEDNYDDKVYEPNPDNFQDLDVKENETQMSRRMSPTYQNVLDQYLPRSRKTLQDRRQPG